MVHTTRETLVVGVKKQKLFHKNIQGYIKESWIQIKTIKKKENSVQKVKLLTVWKFPLKFAQLLQYQPSLLL